MEAMKVDGQPKRLARGPSDPTIGGRAASGYIWLVYSVFFFVEPILRHQLGFWLQSLGSYAVFLAIYISYIQTRSRQWRFVILGGFYVLGLLCYPTNSGSSCFFIYVAAFLPFLVESVPIVAGVLAAQCIGIVIEAFVFHVNPIGAGATVLFTVAMGASDVFVAKQKRADSKLLLAQAEIVQLAALAERERIARDLHDVLGHTLSVIVLKAELAGRLLAPANGQAGGRDPERAAREIADVERTARAALTEVREAIGGYRSQGLPAEMDLARSALSAAGVALSCESALPKLAAAEETVLCLAMREAVTNIVRHAGAGHCRVRFETTDDGFHALTVEDDGAGLRSEARMSEGNGLRGMRERVQTLGGRFSVARGPAGTKLSVELPVGRMRRLEVVPECAP